MSTAAPGAAFPSAFFRRVQRWTWSALRLGACALLAAGSASASAAAPADAVRVVSVGGGVTEIVYALGAQSQLVAVDTSSVWPAAVHALPKIGYQRALSAEGVLSLNPTLLLAAAEAGPPPALRQIEDAGVCVVRIDGDYSFEGLRARIARAAAALDRAEAGRELDARLSAQWQTLQRRIAAQPPRADGRPLRVAFLMMHGASAMAAGRDTGGDALLRHAGAVNAFGEQFDNYKPLAPEALAAAAPDFIVATVDDGDRDAALARLRALPGAALTDAVRQNRVETIDVVLALGFGPRLPQAVQALYDAFTR